MKVLKLAAIALLATGSSIAIAQAADTNANAPQGLIQRVTSDLQASGLRNVEVMPGSFLVHATDRNGDPVSIYLAPDQMTEVTDVAMTTAPKTDGQSSPLTNVSDVSSNAGNANSVVQSDFRNIPAGDELGTQVIGLDVHNADNKSIGSIKDIAMDRNGQVNGYILSVGGFLGIGEHNVAVQPGAVHLTWDSHARKWSAEMNTTAAQLKAAPEYTYSS